MDGIRTVTIAPDEFKTLGSTISMDLSEVEAEDVIRAIAKAHGILVQIWVSEDLVDGDETMAQTSAEARALWEAGNFSGLVEADESDWEYIADRIAATRAELSALPERPVKRFTYTRLRNVREAQIYEIEVPDEILHNPKYFDDGNPDLPTPEFDEWALGHGRYRGTDPVPLDDDEFDNVLAEVEKS